MALEGQQGVVAQHSATVVCDANELSSTAIDVDANLCGARIEGILDELFDHRGRAFHHLACRDFVSAGVGEASYFAHTASRRFCSTWNVLVFCGARCEPA